MKKFYIYSIVFLVLALGVFFASTSLSTIETTPTQIKDCRIVLPGDMCDTYSKCLYSVERDISCIRGYEDKTTNYDDYEVQYYNPITEEVTGGFDSEK